MIINGQAVKGATRLANHLLKEENEQVKILEISGTTSNDNLHDALRDMEALGQLTRSQTGKVLYHANIDPRKDEILTAEQYIKSADRLMEELGFEGQPRAIVQHTKKGRQHAHLVVQLTDLEKGKLKKISNNYYKHKEVARELEHEFQLEQTSERKTGKSYSQSHAQQAQKLHKSVRDYRTDIRLAYDLSKTGKEFNDKLLEKGLVLAQGKRLVVLDREGSPQSLTRQLKDMAQAKQVKEKLGDIISELPSIDDAQKSIREQKVKDNSDNLDRSAARYERLKKEFSNTQAFDDLQESAEKRRQYYKKRFDQERGY